MTWPFVSRDRLDAMQRLLDIAHADARQERSIADARYDELLAKFTALRLAGADVTPPAAQSREAAKPDPVLQAIIAKSGSSVPLRNHYITWVAQQRSVGKTEGEITALILQGHSDDAEGVAG